MADFLLKPKHRHIKEIPLAPILDLLVVVIFFLILSASFIEVRQNTLPPSSTAKAEVTADQPETLPLNPKVLVVQKNNEFLLLLKWFGAKPGQIEKKSPLFALDQKYNFELKQQAAALVTEFLKDHPLEKSIQIGYAGKTHFQDVISVFDGVFSVTKDIVLLSDQETEALASASH